MMAEYQYKCVKVPEVIGIGKNQSHSEVVTAYQDIINSEAKGQWEYKGVDTIESDFQPGCIGGLLASIPILGMFFRKSETVRFKVLVFQKVL